MKPSKGTSNPKYIWVPKDGGHNGPDDIYQLRNSRITRPCFNGAEVYEYWDVYDHGKKDKKVDQKDPDIDILERIMKEKWIGPTLFRKSSSDPEPHSKPTFLCRDRRNDCASAGKDRDPNDHGKTKKKELTPIEKLEMTMGIHATMEDAFIPCAQEHESWDNAYEDIETQRHLLEELAIFERAADRRMNVMRGNNGYEAAQIADLEALKLHNEPPRLLTDHDFKEGDNFVMKSKRGRHRQKIVNSPIMHHDLLIARSISRKEYLGNPEAMAAYWKEWKNLEENGVWRWETLTEFSDVKGDVIAQGGEAHFGYLFGIMVEKGAEFRWETSEDTSSIEWSSRATTQKTRIGM